MEKTMERPRNTPAEQPKAQHSATAPVTAKPTRQQQQGDHAPASQQMSGSSSAQQGTLYADWAMI
jgi:hypothetical protein